MARGQVNREERRKAVFNFNFETNFDCEIPFFLLLNIEFEIWKKLVKKPETQVEAKDSSPQASAAHLREISIAFSKWTNQTGWKFAAKEDKTRNDVFKLLNVFNKFIIHVSLKYPKSIQVEKKNELEKEWPICIL